MKTFLLWATGLFVLAVVFGFTPGAADPNSGAKSQARAAIEMCQKAQDDPLSPMNARRFARDTCDMMRGEFSRQFGTNP